eukprot:CAMPEP_0184983310 /NCGR_PEP_ID=MMETSP1098-20130426/12565_1 /TAXON_ID=89044 /ORGANISM="Spumella elongata, Strain CCAP 955/1" /LENGTH=819 /DNA_ID=CAMNT_0027507119 /DNA_START=63 /DNA_END=2522 /DNA_ORIENTATION=+
MFSTQDSIDFGPAAGIGDPQESASPVRKKGRNKHFSSHKSENVNPFAFSQDSMGPSQYSQNFTDRMGQLNMFSSQENSNISTSDSAFSVPYMPHLSAAATAENTLNNARQNSGLSLSKFNISSLPKEATSTASSTNFESERPIDIAPPVKNGFLLGAKPHSEMYMNPIEQDKKKIKPTKVWIGAFKERPRVVTEFEEVRLLGEGTFSTVICARHRLDGTLYAIKRIRESIISERQGHTLLREVNALAALQGCEQVVKYHSCWIDNHHLFIQTELCHLGSLEDLISPTPNRSSIIFTATAAKQFFLNGGHTSSVTSKNTAYNHERNRSESFNSIDLNDFEGLIHDECLTAPGPPAGTSAGIAADLHTPHGNYQQASSGLFFSQPSTNNNNNNNNSNHVLQNTLPSNTTATTFSTTQYTQNSLLSQNSNNNMMDESGSGFRTQDGPPANYTSHNNTIGMNGDTSGGVRGVSEDLAWLLLYEISTALKYMHDREMVHLDLRPANVFLTCAASYHTMDSLDPQRLIYCSLVNDSSTPSGAVSKNGSSNSSSMGGTLFSHILNAPTLQSYSNINNNSTGNTTHNNAATTTSSTSGHLFTRTNTENSTSSTTNNTHTTTTTGDAAITSSMTPAEAASYDVRTQVERLLVNRDYLIKLGDLGHCCRIDEKSQFQEGQTRYLARELINMEEGLFDAYKADIFSLGATVYELCLGRYLGAEGEEGIAEWHSIRDGHLHPSLAAHYSKELVEMLHLLTHPDPQTRPSAQALQTSLLCQYYPGTNANKLFPHNSGNNGKNSSNCNTSGVNSELERVLEENRRLKQQLGLR